LINEVSGGGRATDALAAIAAAEGMAPLPAGALPDVVLLKAAARTEDLRLDAVTAYVTALVAAGARIDYWDAVSHLYPEGEMEGIRRRRAEEEAKARQMQAVKDMMGMSRQNFGGYDVERWGH